MKFLEIADGEAIKVDSIEKVKRLSELQSRLFCGFETYDVTLPYGIVLNIIENSDKSDSDTQLLKDISQKVGNIGVFAG